MNTLQYRVSSLIITGVFFIVSGAVQFLSAFTSPSYRPEELKGEDQSISILLLPFSVAVSSIPSPSKITFSVWCSKYIRSISKNQDNNGIFSDHPFFSIIEVPGFS
ncbi:hypothetical protein L1887_15439 [Cichorium endivia]|nr:hypothetical protein L1887_15439 [Cichorium endivia]